MISKLHFLYLRFQACFMLYASTLVYITICLLLFEISLLLPWSAAKADMKIFQNIGFESITALYIALSFAPYKVCTAPVDNFGTFEEIQFVHEIIAALTSWWYELSIYIQCCRNYWSSAHVKAVSPLNLEAKLEPKWPKSLWIPSSYMTTFPLVVSKILTSKTYCR